MTVNSLSLTAGASMTGNPGTTLTLGGDGPASSSQGTLRTTGATTLDTIGLNFNGEAIFHTDTGTTTVNSAVTGAYGLTKTLPGTLVLGTSNPAFDADPDHDGIANGLEWILGGSPTANDRPSILPTVTGTASGGLTLVFNRNPDSAPPAATLVVEWDSDLNIFAHAITIGTTDIAPSGDNPSVDIDAPSAGKVTVNIPNGNAPDGRIFARLKAVQP